MARINEKGLGRTIGPCGERDPKQGSVYRLSKNTTVKKNIKIGPFAKVI